jgi:hypothetical protein
MHKITFLIFSLLICQSAFAGLFDNRLQQYRCKDAEQAHSCTSCEVTDLVEKGKSYFKIEFEFKVDKQQNRVMMIVFDLGKMAQSDYLDNCKVIDNKNWICTNKNSLVTSTKKMVKGIYTGITLDTDKSNIYTDYQCAK